MTSPPPLTPIVEEAGQQGGEVVVEEGHPPEAAPDPKEARKVGGVEQPAAEVVEGATGAAGSEAGIFGDCGSFEKI